MNTASNSVFACVCAVLAFFMPSAMAAPGFPLEGKVVETREGDRYLYLKVDNEQGDIWVATMPGPIRSGDRVKVADGVVMENHASLSLGRTFSSVVFADRVERAGAPAARAGSHPTLPPGHPPLHNRPAPAECPVQSGHVDPQPEADLAGEIVETMNAGGYTYLKVKVKGRDGEVWAATNPFEAKVGQSVVLSPGMVVRGFTSASLGRTFEEIHFVDRVTPAGLPPGHPVIPVMGKAGAGKAADEVEVVPEDPPQGGLSVAEIHRRKSELAGRQVLVRGTVVRFSPSIMGRNWIHVRDGSAEGDDGDLTLTTLATAAIGDRLSWRGTIVLDASIGPHYRQPVLLEDASIVP